LQTTGSPRFPPAPLSDGRDPGRMTREATAAATSCGAAGTSLRRSALLACALFGTSVLLCLLGYLALAVPGHWFPGTSEEAWGPRDLRLVRGTGAIVGDEMLVTGVDSTGIAVVSVNSNLHAADFPAIAWVATDIGDDADVRLIWRADARPQRMNSVAVAVTAGRALPTILANDPAWVGPITGIALVIRGNVEKPIRIRGVIAKPMGAVEILRDRAREWLAFEEWTGTSINTVVGGADIQDLPLPPLMAATCAIASALLLALRRWRPGITAGTPAGLALALFVLAWLVLDARWTWNLVRQEQLTVRDYGGKSLAGKHLAADDAALFDFVERARGVMPQTPVRVFVVADAAYFRGRAAYHLYPHNVYADRGNSAMPPASVMRPGDWLFDYEKRGIVYDAARGTLRWGGDQTIAAELRLLGPGAALFLIR
jgi:hypothetical protein